MNYMKLTLKMHIIIFGKLFELTYCRVQNMHVDGGWYHVGWTARIITIVTLIRFRYQQNARRSIRCHLDTFIVIDHFLLVVPEDISRRFRRLSKRTHQPE